MGYYRFATQNSTNYAYCIFRIKGDSRAHNNQIYTRIAAQGPVDTGGISDNGGTSERELDTLLGPDSLPVPAITTQFQTIVVDMKKNKLSFGNGTNSNAFQIGTHAPMELDIDYIFMSNTNPLSATPPSNLGYKHNPATYVTNAAITPDTPVVTGTVDSFTVSPNLPAGLSLAKITGIITGTPTTATSQATYIVTARNAAGSTTVSLSIIVAAALSPPANLSYKHNPVTYVTNAAISPDTAAVSGSVDSFTVAPGLPAGLQLDKTTGILSGTPATATGQAAYTVTARNAAGSTTVSLSITVAAALAPPANLSYKHNPVTYVAGAAIVPDSAAVIGSVDSFTVSPGLPGGLLLDKATGIVSGTPTAAAAQTAYTVTARNAAGSTFVSLSITVNAAATLPVITAQPVSDTVDRGQAVTFTVSPRGHPGRHSNGAKTA